MAIITAKNRTRRTEVRTTLMEIHPFFGRQKGRKITEMNPSGRRDTGIARIRKRRVPRGRSPVCRFVFLFSIHEMRHLSMCILHNATELLSFFEKTGIQAVIFCEPGAFSVVRKSLVNGNNWLTQRASAWYTILHKERYRSIYTGVLRYCKRAVFPTEPPAPGFGAGRRKDGTWKNGYCFPGRQRRSSLP